MGNFKFYDMAKQVGLLKLVGTLGDISFYKSFYGFLARRKTGVDRKTVLRDPRFQRTRENASEFGRAAKAGKLLRDAIQPLPKHARDSMMVQRLAQRMMKVLQSDTVNGRGMRTVAQGELSLLNGFDFNINAKLDTTIHTGFEARFDRFTGEANLDLNTHFPKRDIKAPHGVTHYKVSFGVAALNFDALKSICVIDESEMLSKDSIVVREVSMTAIIQPGLSFPVVLLMGISFYQEVNGEFFGLEDRRFNTLGIVGIH